MLKYADSLSGILHRAPSDSVKARAAFELSELWSTSDTLQSSRFLEQGRQLAGKSAYLQTLHRFYRGHYLAKAGNDNAQPVLLQADTLLSRFNTKEAALYRSKVWYDYGALEQRKDNPKGFADILVNKAIPFAEKADNKAFSGRCHLALAMVFKNAGEYDKAETYCLKAIELERSGNAPPNYLAMAYFTIAENYTLAAKTTKARPVLDTLRQILAEDPESSYMLDYYAVEALYWGQEKQADKTLVSVDKGIALARKLKLRYEEQRLLFQKFFALHNSNNFSAAIDVLKELMQQPEMMMLATNRTQIYGGMALSYEGLHKWDQAYSWMKRYAELSDSIAASKLKNDVHAMEIKFNNAEKQKEIDALKAKSVQEALAAKNSRLFNWLLGSASIFLLVVLIFVQQLYRSRKILMAQKELTYRQQLHEIEQRQQLQFSQAIIQGEEQERRRLARDLHDGLGGMLAGARLNLSGQMNDTLSTDHRAELERVTNQLDSSVTELRRIAHNLMPVNLLKFGLETALRDLSTSLMNDTTRIDFQALDISDTLPEEVQIHVYRIVQELLSNSIRHGHASHIILQCSQNGDVFYITQEDNGKGFNPEKVSNGMGLGNIKNRVGFLRGKIEIESVENEGTTVNIELHVK
ncbi:MAG TPA: sensor histidine kinase [Chitinophaga sp.]|uniref:tetratricopeptide repeat-containing sensor histidine kinase n=1 Tax=Chitinophaga sp. TaxID=1869181 RepID=UPI002B71CD89|nr:sensor histidine kinase [Chitinophaga sp.]HVI44173.1 sensor histidine kinase [Chitinophaga sp.]